MRALRIYSLNDLQIYHTAVLTVIITFYITSPVFIYLIARSLYLLNHFHPVLFFSSDVLNEVSM